MAYDFGANINDRIAFSTIALSPMNANRVSLVCCWLRPTTLTTNRAPWTMSNTSGIVVGATTSNVTLVLDAATLDGNYTGPVGLAVNTWTFVAVLWNQGASGVAACKMWTATEASSPVEVTVTVDSVPSGTWTGGGTTFTAGNLLSGGGAFQGAVGGVSVFTDSTNSNLNPMCGIAAAGAITQAQADAVRGRFVDPLWRGDIAKVRNVRGTSGFGFSMSASLDNSVAGGAWSLRSDQPPVLGAITSATASALRTPHSFDDSEQPRWDARRSGLMVRV